jgi:transcriptional regulator with XRE-family HTH domain
MSVVFSTLAALPILQMGPTSSSSAMAKRLNITRRALNLSQTQICRETGISFGSWNNAETGNSKLSVKQSEKLFHRYGIDLCWIHLGFTGFLPDDIRPKIQSLMMDDPSVGYKRPKI